MVPFVKADLNVLPEATAIVIASGLGVPDGLGKASDGQVSKMTRASLSSGL